MKIDEIKTLVEERLQLMKQVEKIIDAEVKDLPKDRKDTLKALVIGAKYPERLTNDEDHPLPADLHFAIAELSIKTAYTKILELNARINQIEGILNDKSGDFYKVCQVKYKFLKEALEEYFVNKTIDLNLNEIHPIYLSKKCPIPVSYHCNLSLVICDADNKVEYDLGTVNICNHPVDEDDTIYLRSMFSYNAEEWEALYRDYPNINEALYSAIEKNVNESKLAEIGLIKKRIEERNAKLAVIKDPAYIQKQIDELEQENNLDSQIITNIEETLA